MSSGTNIITLIGMIGLALLAFLFIKNKVTRLRREKAIRVHGIKTTAEIKEIVQAGANEFGTRVRLRLLVEDHQGGRYYAQTVVSIDNTHMPQFQPGCKIDVAYDPANPKSIVVLSPTSGRLTSVKANTQESWQEGVQESYKLVLDDPGYDRANVTKILGKILFEQVQSLDPLSHSSQNLLKSSMLWG
ncbi:MAG: DUF3592 domain-containing protein [Peptococcaceae bacterium]|nr:DUF3592 domain-containing protein [Peptococcaceae bacterium]